MSQPSCIYPVGWYRSAILVVAPFLFGVVIVNVLLMLFGYLYIFMVFCVIVLLYAHPFLGYLRSFDGLRLAMTVSGDA